MKSTLTIGSYIIQKLYEHGVNHVFGVPGDYVLGFYNQLLHDNKLKIINTCDESSAAFAADAYARVKGFGALCITYCVGGLTRATWLPIDPPAPNMTATLLLLHPKPFY